MSEVKVTNVKHFARIWSFPDPNSSLNRMAWQSAETLVEIRVTQADIRGTTN